MRLVPLVAFTVGCVAVPPQSEVLGRVSAAMFRDYDADPDALALQVASIDDTLAGFDLTGRVKDRSFVLPPLSPTDRGSVGGPRHASGRQVTAGVAAVSSHPVDALATTFVETDQVCINADAVGCHRRTLEEGGDCFLDGGCDELRTGNDILVQGTGVRVWLDVNVDFRWVTLPDGRSAVVSRSWMPKEAISEGGRSTWEERLGLDVFVEDLADPGQTVRWYATWTVVNLPWWLGEELYRSALVDGIEAGFRNPDAWLDGEECGAKIPETCDFPER